MPKINKSIYKLSSRYRNQLLNQAVRNVNNNILSSADGDDDNDEHNINLESSVFFSDNNEKDELNMHNSNCLQHKQQRNFEYNELSFHRDNINDDCLVTSDLSAILSESSYDKFLKLYDLCERCSLCICFLDCVECFHNEIFCQHCKKFGIVDYDNNYKEIDNYYKEFDIYCETISFRDKLTQWALDTKINHHQLRSLLTILNSEHPEDNLPKDARTLMKTSLKIISLRNVSPGQYWHNGLTKQLSILYKDTNIMELKLTFNIDGVPISMSSSSTLWVILCSDIIFLSIFIFT